jgi:aspartate/methionine/tyrosine aminotransferase
MSFPLAEWIDGHADCRYNLAISGMIGSIPSPSPSPPEVRKANPQELRRRLADDLGVDPPRLFLTTGASQANALALLFLARRHKGASRGVCRYCPPEYPPLFDTAQDSGFRLTEEAGTAELAIVSQPRNPEGDLWDRARFLDWTSGARSVLVDETFREFAGTRTLLGTGRPGLWASGSFTKFYAGDDLRVGFLVVPEEHEKEFARFHGLATNPLPSASVAGAVRALRDRTRTRAKVLSILRTNRDAARRAFPRLRSPEGPVMFDRPDSGEGDVALSYRALAASVLVCPGSYFDDPSGVRLCLTRRSFPADLRAYLAVRDRISRRRASRRR